MRVRDLIVGFFRADVPLAEIDPYRRAGADAYDLIDIAPPAGWVRLAAWNAFLLQVYGDNLVTAGSSDHYVTADIALFARHLYALANVWVLEAHKAQASDAYSFAFDLPHPLPHWHDQVRTDAQLEGMRLTLETGRTRVASELERFDCDARTSGVLRVRLAEIDANAGYVERLWTEKPSYELRCTMGDVLADSLDDTYDLGHLLAQPALLVRFS